MPTITFSLHTQAGQRRVAVSAETGDRILSVALAHQIEIEHACEGSCACSTCHVTVREGFDSLSPPSEREDDLLDQAWGVELSSRLACQAVLGEQDIVVEVPRYSINYSQAPQPPSPQARAIEGCVQQRLEWSDSAAIAGRLFEKFPTIAPDHLRFTDLHARVCALDGFEGEEEASTEALLEAILAAWLDLRD